MRYRIGKVHGLCTFNDKSAQTASNDTEATTDANVGELTIPESFSDHTSEQLDAFLADAEGVFAGLYGDGENISAEDHKSLSALRDGIVAARDEKGVRQAENAARAAEAAQFAADIQGTQEAPADDAQNETAEDAQDGSEDAPAADESAPADEAPAPAQEAQDEAPAADVTEAPASASQTAPRRVARVRRPAPTFSNKLPKDETAKSPLSAVDTGNTRYKSGAPITFSDAAEIMANRLARFNEGAYRAARRNGQHMRETFQLATFSRPSDPALTITHNDAAHGDSVLNHAADETRLPGGSLVASGGWCAPSTIDHSVPGALSTAEGVFRLPEVQAPRGGLTRTLGPKFSDLYAVSEGFRYTEAQDIAGDYDGNGGGSKPCIEVDCPDFQEFRLDMIGYCVSAGLLKKRAYPEYLARFLQEFLTGYEHHLAKNRLMTIRAGSTASTMPSDKGAAAPLLRAIEMQAMHLRSSHRMSDSRAIEVIMPKWVRAVLRDDLARRNGVDLLNVNDAQIDAWFRDRKVAVQYVDNWQDIAAYNQAQLTGWPNRVEFLMYPAGTWVEAVTDIISISDLFDSTQLKQNHYTALFAESGSVIVPMGHDSRVVTVPLEATGSTGSAVAHPANSVDAAVMYSASMGTTTTTSTTTTTTTV